MAAPTGVLWSRDPHTAAKHEILRRYLEAWFPILASMAPRTGLAYVDAFAGPGEYDDRSWGSPMIALAQAHRQEVTRHHKPQHIVLVEEQKNRLDHLVHLVDAKYPPTRRGPNILIHSERGDCRQILIPLLNRLRITTGPIFVNLDGWGVDTPMHLVRHIGRMDTSEVLITFKPGWFWRFVNSPAEAGDRVFGDSTWRQIAAEGSAEDKKRNLVSHYRDQLHLAGFKYQLAFELLDEGGHELFLVFGTSHDLGVERMKTAMWKVDSAEGRRFRDPRDPHQLALDLDEEADLNLLKSQLLEYLTAEGPASMAELKEYALFETIFLATHAPEAVQELENGGLVHRTRARRHEDQIVELSLFGHAAVSP